MWQTKPYLAVIGIQKLVEANTKVATGKDLAMLSRAYVSLELLKLRLRMKGAPKPVDVAKLDKAARPRTSAPNFSES